MNMYSYKCCNVQSDTELEIQELSGLLKIVAEQNRLLLLCILKDGGEHCVCEFLQHTNNLSQSLVSHHLADLKQAGLVINQKRGLKMYYKLTNYGKYVTQNIFMLINNEEYMSSVQKSKSCCTPYSPEANLNYGNNKYCSSSKCAEFKKCNNKEQNNE